MLWFLRLLAGLFSTCKPGLNSRPSMAHKHVATCERIDAAPIQGCSVVPGALLVCKPMTVKCAALDFVCALDSC